MVREKIGLQTDRQTDGHGDNISVFFPMRKKALKINIYILLLRAYVVREFDVVPDTARFCRRGFVLRAFVTARFCLRAFVCALLSCALLLRRRLGNINRKYMFLF